MELTLQVNDRLMIDKLSCDFSLPNRGDVIVLNPSQALEQQNDHETLIKQVIGQPSKKVEVSSDRVYVNSQPLREKYVATLPIYYCGSAIVPSDNYLVLGDNTFDTSG
ncbi:signal peptidase I [Nodosilinea nodulosa]|uniref:signal peptidase I n=1 Tax=Nodosilinea nodulosa TaxID=416001 RepID=UPI0009FDDA9F|nr:signal peptidase I [Nodosilinea nodulosa]